ncbi:MAG: sugar ABC transporter ATP-binding protein [Deltaproteobacteria bacterium]|nr:sugar ABC transporter ATP-binding protein [Deltaproteobacteria bacterium]
MRLSIRGVRKAFEATVALSAVDLDLAPGEVHAVLGENGAGKSTLMAILAGAIAPDGGAITLDGAPYAPKTPRQAQDAGVAIVHQELSLCPHLTVEENVLLGREPTRFGLVDVAAGRARVRAALERVGAASVDPRTRAGELPSAAQQLVEIARTLAHEQPRVLILDEPTSSLGGADAERLLSLVRELRDRGVSILYVSHFLEEIERVCDRFTVLRDGATVGAGRIGEVDVDGLVTMMAGRTVERLFERRLEGGRRAPGETLLDVRALSGAPRPDQASFAVRRGEVLGVAGLVGAGRTELLRAIFGLDRVVSGEVRVGAWMGRGPRSPAESLRRDVGLLSEDRKREGLALGRSVSENVTLSKLPAIVRRGDVTRATRTWVERLGIRVADVDAPVSHLSGGNQQKVALARLLHHDVDVLLLDEPTRGIDVRSKAEIYATIDGLAAAGKAIVVVSSWLPELLGLCDRIAVMRRGRLGEARPTESWTEHDLLREALGA